jgi:hypothetical protein
MGAEHQKKYAVTLELELEWRGAGLPPTAKEVAEELADDLRRGGLRIVHVTQGNQFSGSPVYLTAVKATGSC